MPLVLFFLLAAQADIPLRSNVQLVVAPTVVTDRQGHFIRGLTEQELILRDNNVPAKIHLDDDSLPISLVVALQTTASARDVLEKLRNETMLVEPLLSGEGGDAAVIAFADGVHVMQPFTPNPDLVTNAIQNVEITGEGGSGIDAVVASLRLLTRHEGDRRRVILLLAEKHDRTSKFKLNEALTIAQRANVTIYSLTFSPFLTPFTNRQPTPATSDMNLAPVFGELKRAAQKDITSAFAKTTGGLELGFLTKKGLEDAVRKIGEDLHGQYLLSFQPRDLHPGEFHRIRVEVKGHPDYLVRTRAGYWSPQ
jgi:VWFA-related protein